ncbi:IcmT/TraK family protein [Acetobacter sp. TBRC 12305]|uniref:IcmT/TraK family protein n=1 Tax=Acetobacter garciniae TaxID=2817435 RepID=A0A939KP04_9PROT|nr:IcmT/TraK family protein [Acetobacter garciniae]MBO1326260.1 IcmT/TraK family protein [Acetobacter garciniae]MBX0346002.1 IcmT/TraK family protein [Acetobacter garciniae]
MWRYSADPVYIFVLDCRALLPMVVFFAHMREWTLIVAVAGTLIFGFLAWMGLTLPVAGRMLRVLIIGARRPALPAWKKRAYA